MSHLYLPTSPPIAPSPSISPIMSPPTSHVLTSHLPIPLSPLFSLALAGVEESATNKAALAVLLNKVVRRQWVDLLPTWAAEEEATSATLTVGRPAEVGMVTPKDLGTSMLLVYLGESESDLLWLPDETRRDVMSVVTSLSRGDEQERDGKGHNLTRKVEEGSPARSTLKLMTTHHPPPAPSTSPSSRLP